MKLEVIILYMKMIDFHKKSKGCESWLGQKQLNPYFPQFPYGNKVEQICFLKTGSLWENICTRFMKYIDQPLIFSEQFFPKDVSSHWKRKWKTLNF